MQAPDATYHVIAYGQSTNKQFVYRVEGPVGVTAQEVFTEIARVHGESKRNGDVNEFLDVAYYKVNGPTAENQAKATGSTK